MKKDKKEEHYPKELKEKVEKGQPIKPDEEDKFENEYGRYKSRKDTAVIDLLNAINKGNNLTDIDLACKCIHYSVFYKNVAYAKQNKSLRYIFSRIT